MTYLVHIITAEGIHLIYDMTEDELNRARSLK